MTTRPSESRPFPSRLDDKNAEFEIAIDSTFIDPLSTQTRVQAARRLRASSSRAGESVRFRTVARAKDVAASV